jgi:Ca2+-binding RTX toxin-like protein
MIGGPGNDTYIADALDRLIEAAGGGIDTVVTAGSYRLPVHFENLRLVGTAPVNGTGNAANNLIVGNGAANVLSGEGGNDRLLGGGGNDRLFGGVGNDTLDGQAGADFMVGGPGNDTYTVDNRGDRVVEAANGGTDTVRSAISLGLAAHVENLTLLGNRRSTAAATPPTTCCAATTPPTRSPAAAATTCSSGSAGRTG